MTWWGQKSFNIKCYWVCDCETEWERTGRERWRTACGNLCKRDTKSHFWFHTPTRLCETVCVCVCVCVCLWNMIVQSQVNHPLYNLCISAVASVRILPDDRRYPIQPNNPITHTHTHTHSHTHTHTHTLTHTLISDTTGCRRGHLNPSEMDWAAK